MLLLSKGWLSSALVILLVIAPVATASGQNLLARLSDVRAVVYDWADRMVAEYAYLDLKVDPSLEARDFDPTNPGYAFPRWKISR